MEPRLDIRKAHAGLAMSLSRRKRLLRAGIVIPFLVQ